MPGTGNAIATECYNTCFVLNENDNYFVMDGGGGNTVIRQLTHVELGWMAMREIFITQHIPHE